MKKVSLFLGILVAGGVAWAASSPQAPAKAEPVRNVIWLIGDGMGPELMGFFMQGVRQGHLSGYPDATSALEQFLQEGEQGLYFNHTQATVVTDSAASATQMATGALSLPERIGMDEKGQAVPTLLEMAQQKGKAIGIISDTYVTDATPAGFTAHTLSRKDKMEIARQQLALQADVILGGGRKYFTTGENKKLLDQARQQGYQVVHHKKGMSKVRSGKLLGLFAEQSLPMSVEMYAHAQVPSLAEMTQKAVALLEQNPNGFVLMVEAGKIDWAAHAQDAGAVLAEMKVLDKTLDFIHRYAKEHPDTLVYVNADHDTGMGAFAYQVLNAEQAARKTEEGEVLYDGDTYYGTFDTYALLEKQKRSFYYVAKELSQIPVEKRTAATLQKRLSAAAGYPLDITAFENLQDIPGLFKQLNDKYGISWATPNHSAAMLIGVAYGPYQELFKGVYHNTDILPKLKTALGWREE